MACRRKRKCSSLPPSQWLISDFYAPKSGISKEAVNFKVKTPERSTDLSPNSEGVSSTYTHRKQTWKKYGMSADRSDCTSRLRSSDCSSNLGICTSSTVPYNSYGSKVDTLSWRCDLGKNINTIPMSFRSTKSKRRKNGKSGPTYLQSGQSSEATLAHCSSTLLSPIISAPTSDVDPECFIVEPSTTQQTCSTDRKSRNLHAAGLQNCDHQVSRWNTSVEKDRLNSLPSSSSECIAIQSDESEETNKPNPSPIGLLSEEDSLWSRALDEFGCGSELSDSELMSAAERWESSQEQMSLSNGDVQADRNEKSAFMFGLLGTDSDGDINCDDEEEKINLFSRLPDEVIENIFCQLPMMDLLLNCALVCHQWNDIISNEKFIPWKKRYYKLKKEDRRTQDSVVRILDDGNLYEEELLPQYLARFMENFRRGNSVPLIFLKEHPKFCLIESFMATLIPSSEKELSPWSVIGLLTLISSTVEDITHVITCMEKSSSCLVHDVIECLYCLATVYFALQMQNRINPGLHYRVFYALYLYENKFHAALGCDYFAADSSDTVGGPCVMKYRCPSDSIQLTHEQLRVVKHKILPGEMVKIVAFAGTGKTTTLVQLTQRNPEMKFLNLAYNSAVQQQAEKLFPPNVRCKTTHSWAYKYMWKRYQHKLEYGKFGTGKITNILTKCHFLHARRVEETLNNFIASSDALVTDQHVPPRHTITVGQFLAEEALGDFAEGGGEFEEEYNYYDSPDYIKKVVQDVAYLWRRMSNPRDKDVRITHDGYLKVYQLSKPTITGFDCLLIDEAQDCTPAASDIFLRQRCSKILVGDPNQQIYGFRGARNAMREAQGNSTYFLTQSFRFGPDIAYVAATILNALKGETRNTLVGSAKDSGVAGDQIGQLAIITRSNFALFNEASRIASEENRLKIAFAGGLDKFGLDRVLDIHKLFTAGSAATASLGIKDNLIKLFKSFSKFKAYCKRARDAELLGKIKIVETHHVMLPERVEKIRSKNTSHMEQADIVFSTVHKAKGLEFDTVRITDDFLVSNEGIQTGNRDDDERNLLYVAVTRAKKRLQLTRLLVKVLAGKKEYFLRAVSPQKALPASTTVTCIRCKEEHDFSASKRPHVVVERPKITLGNGDEIQGGILCPSCASRNIGYLGCMVSPDEHQPVV